MFLDSNLVIQCTILFQLIRWKKEGNLYGKNWEIEKTKKVVVQQKSYQKRIIGSWSTLSFWHRTWRVELFHITIHDYDHIFRVFRHLRCLLFRLNNKIITAINNNWRWLDAILLQSSHRYVQGTETRWASQKLTSILYVSFAIFEIIASDQNRCDCLNKSLSVLPALGGFKLKVRGLHFARNQLYNHN